MIEMEVWKYQYRPFQMGGSVDKAIKCTLLADGPHDLGKGWFGYVVTSPSGYTQVAEAESGGIVGETLEQVRADVWRADVGYLHKQVKEAKKGLKSASGVPPIEFWGKHWRLP